MTRKLLFPGLAVFLFCACQSHALLSVWAHAPFDRFGWLAFLLWVFPVALARPRMADERLLLVAAAFSLLGAASDFNVLLHAGLAVSLIAFMPFSRGALLPWICAAPVWMPLFGWFGSSLGTGSISVARVCIASAAALWACGALRANKPQLLNPQLA